MTTSDISFDPALHAYQESDALHVLDLVLRHQIGTFSALEIAQVAELLPSWIPRNIVALTNGRADVTRDWYFPVYTRKAVATHPRSRTSSSSSSSSSSSWCGIHHLAENHASATVHPLPPLPALPLSWSISSIVASAGGLLLLMPPIYPIPSLETGESRLPCVDCKSVGNRHLRECWKNSNDYETTRSWLRYADSIVPQNWKPLLVCNPLTKTWRELPAVAAAAAAAENSNGGSSLKWRYDEVLIDIIVDDSEQANSYTIVMTFLVSFCMCIYTSRSNTWARHQYAPFLRRPERAPGMIWNSHIHANVVVRGRLHYAFLEYRHNASTRATFRVFEIQVATGEWRPWKRYALRVRVWRTLAAPFVQQFPNLAAVGRERKASEVARYLALVECMGDMYAVVPSRLDEFLTNNTADHVRTYMDVDRSQDDDESSEAMPVQFHILGLNRDQNNRLDLHGVLRICVPDDRTLVQRRMSLLQKTTNVQYWNWFSCTARGSVIWVTCEDYLLQYDVVSGKSKTQIIPKPLLADAGISYRPSFHMKP